MKRLPHSYLPHPPPASLRRSSLRPALCTCVFRRSRSSTIPPLPPAACTQFPFILWGVHPSQVPLRLCVPASPSLSSPPNHCIVRSLVSLSGGFSRKGERLGIFHSLEVVRPSTHSPPLLGHSIAVQDTRIPPPIPPFPPPLFFVIPSPLLE